MRTQEPYIGMDCLSLPRNFSGAGYYMYYLIREILQIERNFPMAVFCKPEHRSLFTPHLKFDDKIISIPLKSRIHRLLFYEYGLEKYLTRENVKLFHATHYLCPPPNKNYKIITTFHDMGFILYPQFYPISKRLYFKNRMKTFLSRSDRIISISKSTKGAIIEFFPEYKRKISLIYPGTDHLSKEDFKPNPIQAFEGPFILAVNSFEKRKNIPFIIELFTHLKQNYGLDHKLVLIGHNANEYHPILKKSSKSKYSADIHVLISIPIEQLISFYRISDFFINAASYEGFGFSPFEAINYDLPAFLFRNQVVGELFNHHPYVLTNLDVESWGKYINFELQNNFENKISPELINNLTWQNTAVQFRELFSKLITVEEMAIASP
jgi:glycosyltransferase involved in cell wall biosynthesis